ncbi:MAG: hypothetical protein MUF58_14860 [Arcicella sp.]|jgi:hypothetical protein|nr:hypothetical protein [Arcicella sp.]
MATNTGKGHRKGAVKKRSQVLNPTTGRYTKRDSETGKFLATKDDGTPFKGIKVEPPKIVYLMNPSVKKSTAKRAEKAVRAVMNAK